jgi:hypothetical protein
MSVICYLLFTHECQNRTAPSEIYSACVQPLGSECSPKAASLVAAISVHQPRSSRWRRTIGRTLPPISIGQNPFPNCLSPSNFRRSNLLDLFARTHRTPGCSPAFCSATPPHSRSTFLLGNAIAQIKGRNKPLYPLLGQRCIEITVGRAMCRFLNVGMPIVPTAVKQ